MPKFCITNYGTFFRLAVEEKEHSGGKSDDAIQPGHRSGARDEGSQPEQKKEHNH